uniref:Equilibrative nucleoside transporter 1 n=1 Tax=Angiostrongylus cantonensis TaxID=6313 RepID=A0A158PCE4_ANGCA
MGECRNMEDMQKYTSTITRNHFRIVFFIILLHGIGVLLPWNMFITIAPNYYVEYWFTINGTKTSYAKSFMSALGITAQIPNFLVSVINLIGSLMIRIAGPLAVNCMNIVVILALVIFQDPSVDAMQWFYIVSLTIVMIMNASNGLYQNSVFGLTADFPATYTNALVVGNNICGTFTSVLSIVSTVGKFRRRLLIVSKMTHHDFYKFYTEKGRRSRLAQNATRPSLAQFLEAFKNCWPQLLSVFMVFFVTLSVFPTVLAGTVPNEKGEPWNGELYAGFTTFLNFNLMAAVGSTAANFIQPGPKTLLVPVLARLLFIPYFMLCNYNIDDRVMPVIFQNEWFFIIGNALMALSSGYFSSLGMMYAPRLVFSGCS